MTTIPEFQDIDLTVSEGIATITLNRPERRNAFTFRMGREIVEALDRTDGDDRIRAVVLTGSGRAFCAGLELGAKGDDRVKQPPKPQPGPFRDAGGIVTLRMFESSKPVIAAINGSAVGFGLTMTLAADVRVVARGARLGFVFGARGLVPDGASSWFLSRIVGLPTALEWCLTARTFSPEEALQKGLVRSIHESDEVVAVARSLAETIRDQVAPVSASLTRQLLWRMASASTPHEAHRLDSQALEFAFHSSDWREGVSAFLDRRAPRWTMRVPRDLPSWYPWPNDTSAAEHP